MVENKPGAGSPPARTSLAAGQTQALFAVAPASRPLTQSVHVRLLAVPGAQWLEGLKSEPTVAESGHPGFEALAWSGLFSPAGTPIEVVNRINADVNAVLEEAPVREALQKQALVVGGARRPSSAASSTRTAVTGGAIIRPVGISIDRAPAPACRMFWHWGFDKMAKKE